MTLRVRNIYAAPLFSCMTRCRKDETMGKGILLWLIGIPIPIIILLWLFFR
ncbi:hypothetical protein [Sphingobium bisphenolivorans]|uniref:hypothetical protein n=1 Tax=Sphingobium bisphenolivorans TaxID=1335760 RepID=UPI0003A806CB|nr:hypothetical protein [Sphingobium bisphenolivorans]